jgi:hypothetical protein
MTTQQTIIDQQDDRYRATVRKLRQELAVERAKLAEVRAFAGRLQSDTERYTIWAGDMLMDVLDGES